MSTVLLAVQDGLGAVLAQQTGPNEAPPLSDKVLQLTKYLTWLLTLAVPIGVIVLLVVLVRVIRSRRRPEPGSHLNWTPPPSAAPPNPIVPPPGAAPVHEIPGPEGWGPPDPTVWGRPPQR